MSREHASRPHRTATRRCRVVLTGVALLAPLFALPPAASAATTGNASINLTKTIKTVTTTPVLGLALGVDKAAAIPDDVLAYTATVTNTGTNLGVTGQFQAGSSGDVTGTVAGWYDEIEYNAKASNTWIAIAGIQATTSGYTMVNPSPITNRLTLTATPQPAAGVSYLTTGDHILGTTLPKGSTGLWTYQATATVPASLVAMLRDASKAGDLRNVVQYEVTPRAASIGQPYLYRASFGNPFPTASTTLSNVTVTIAPPSGQPAQFSKSTTPALASLASGASVAVSTGYRLPVPAAKGGSETDPAYLSRLAGIDRSTLKATAAAAGSSTSGPVTATPAGASSSEHVPIVGISKSGPASAGAGTTASYPLALTNTGSATAGPLVIVDMLPGGATGTVTAVPASLAPAAHEQATATYPIPQLTEPGGLTDTAAVTWADGNGDSYGPVGSSLTTNVTSYFDGATLALAPAAAGPNKPGSSQTLTATFTDHAGLPIAGQDLAFSVSGANTSSGSVTTGPGGTAAYTYTGASGGTDTVTATFSRGAAQELTTLIFLHLRGEDMTHLRRPDLASATTWLCPRCADFLTSYRLQPGVVFERHGLVSGPESGWTKAGCATVEPWAIHGEDRFRV